MIVQRVIVNVKPGRIPEFVALMESAADSGLTQATKRTYTPYQDEGTGTDLTQAFAALPNDLIVPDASVVVTELEFKDVAELEKTWAEYWADPGTPAYMERMSKLTQSAGSEVWTLKDWHLKE